MPLPLEPEEEQVSSSHAEMTLTEIFLQTLLLQGVPGRGHEAGLINHWEMTERAGVECLQGKMQSNLEKYITRKHLHTVFQHRAGVCLMEGLRAECIG